MYQQCTKSRFSLWTCRSRILDTLLRSCEQTFEPDFRVEQIAYICVQLLSCFQVAPRNPIHIKSYLYAWRVFLVCRSRPTRPESSGQRRLGVVGPNMDSHREHPRSLRASPCDTTHGAASAARNSKLLERDHAWQREAGASVGSNARDSEFFERTRAVCVRVLAGTQYLRCPHCL